MLRRLFISLGLFVVAALFFTSATPVSASDGEVGSAGGGDLSTTTGPTPRAAAHYTVTLRRCFFDEARLRVRQEEHGRSGTNYFRQVAQHQVFRDGAWRNRGGPTALRSQQFGDTFANTTWHPGYWYVVWTSEYQFYHRILLRLQWWNNSGTPGYFGDDSLRYTGTATQRC